MDLDLPPRIWSRFIGFSGLLCPRLSNELECRLLNMGVNLSEPQALLKENCENLVQLLMLGPYLCMLRAAYVPVHGRF